MLPAIQPENGAGLHVRRSPITKIKAATNAARSRLARPDQLGASAGFPEIGGGSTVTASVMTWLAGLCAIGLFAYLFYALVKPERF